MGLRKQQLQDWLQSCFPQQTFSLEPASSDASFRRYFRVFVEDETYIAMDAPPDKENCLPFVLIDQALVDHGVHAPDIIAQNLAAGFLLLSDLGSQCYLDQLGPESVDALYGDALDSLHHMQTLDAQHLPPYDEALLKREIDLFSEWFLGRLLGIEADFSATSQSLIESALEQPRVFVHRDFHSRNLMVVADNNPGVIDFQDAVCGPVTYDLASLLRDCYISWPDDRVYDWVEAFRLRGYSDTEPEVFRRWFDLMGVQRHLKAIGIFARLYLRDGKTGYLKDIPRTLGYIQNLLQRYPQLDSLGVVLAQQNVAETFSEFLRAFKAQQAQQAQQ